MFDPRIVIEARMLKFLSELPPGWPDSIITVTATLRDVAAIVTIKPVGAVESIANHHLTSAERDVLEAVRVEVERLGRRALGSEVRAALKAAGCRWGASTVNRALADLVALKLLNNSNDKQGYGVGPGEE